MSPASSTYAQKLLQQVRRNDDAYPALMLERAVLDALFGTNLGSWPPGWTGLGRSPLQSLDDAFDLAEDANPGWHFVTLHRLTFDDAKAVPEEVRFTAVFSNGVKEITSYGNTKQAAVVAAQIEIRQFQGMSLPSLTKAYIL